MIKNIQLVKHGLLIKFLVNLWVIDISNYNEKKTCDVKYIIFILTFIKFQL